MLLFLTAFAVMGVMKVSEIKPINANSEDRGEVYRLLNMVHSMAGQMAQTKAGRWELLRVSTTVDWALTVWGNGIVEVGAETWKEVPGVRSEQHRYWLRPTTGGGNDE